VIDDHSGRDFLAHSGKIFRSLALEIGSPKTCLKATHLSEWLVLHDKLMAKFADQKIVATTAAPRSKAHVGTTYIDFLTMSIRTPWSIG